MPPSFGRIFRSPGARAERLPCMLLGDAARDTKRANSWPVGQELPM